MSEDDEIITLIAGEDVSDEELKEVEAFVEENSDADLEVRVGKQPVYSFIIGVE